MNVQQLATEARNSISSYCMNECHAYCCRKGYLILSEEELNLLTGDKRTELENKEFIKKQEDGMFSFNLGNHLGSCPQLDGSKCSIHKHPKRPLTCEKFPVFVNEDTKNGTSTKNGASKKEARFSSRCPAVRENKLYPYVHEFLKLGFKINKA